MEIYNNLISYAEAHMGDNYYGHHMFPGYDGMMGVGGGVVDGIIMLLFWILAIAGIIYLIRYALQGRGIGEGRRDKTPLEILKERYAKGEMDKDEFERKKKDLS